MVNLIISLLVRPLTNLIQRIQTQSYAVDDLEQSVPVISLDQIRPLQFRIEQCETALLSIQLQLTQHQQVVQQVNRIISLLQTILTVLTLLPIPTAPFPVLVGLILRLSQRVILISGWIDAIKAINNTTAIQLQSMLAEVSRLLDRLRAIDLSYGTIAPSVSSSMNMALEVNYNSQIVGLYTIQIEVASTSKNGLVRHVAIAYNKQGNEIKRSDISFTSAPQLLADQLAWELTHPDDYIPT